MSKDKQPEMPNSQHAAASLATNQQRRAARLAEELRTNLKRRKAVTRTKSVKTDAPGTQD